MPRFKKSEYRALLRRQGKAGIIEKAVDSREEYDNMRKKMRELETRVDKIWSIIFKAGLVAKYL